MRDGIGQPPRRQPDQRYPRRGHSRRRGQRALKERRARTPGISASSLPGCHVDPYPYIVCIVCDRLAARLETSGTVATPQDGAIAQLAERVHGMDEVQGSIPCSSTLCKIPDAWMLGGFVAGEGCFTICVQKCLFADGSPRRKFVFAVHVARRDLALLELLRLHLGGGISFKAPGRPAHQPTAVLAVRSHLAHHQRTIPFMDRYLLPCYKRRQFERWVEALADYENEHPTRWGRGPSTCSEPDCDRTVRGRGLCRSHYYRATGH